MKRVGAFLICLTAFWSGCGKNGPQVVLPPPTPARLGAVERGVASWYGRPYHGRRTSNGEIYDMHALTAAHLSLPFGTVLRVTSDETGRSVDVRINDRGPFVAGRFLDLSRAAAEAIGMVGPGTAPVRAEIVATPGTAPRAGLDPPTPAELAPPPPGPRGDEESGAEPSDAASSASAASLWSVQVGSFRNPDNAERLLKRVLTTGRTAETMPVTTDSGFFYRVLIGSFSAAGEAHGELEAIRMEGFDGIVVRRFVD